MKRLPLLLPVVIVLLAITIPFVVGASQAGKDFQFTGLLLNPLDGSTYLAKMYQGWSGAWKFTLPYTAEAGDGAYLFLFYLFLGHLARLFHLPLILVFHLARIFSAGVLMTALAMFLRLVFPESPEARRTAFWLALFGSGMGWLVVFSGYIPADFWIAEAYPFLSMFLNPHFPLGLALILWCFYLLITKQGAGWLLMQALLGLMIAIILPFGLVVVLLAFGLWSIADFWQLRRLNWLPVFALGSLGGPFLMYQFWVSQADPVLAGWNAQNVTLTPPAWDIVLAFSPVLLLAIYGGYRTLRDPSPPAARLLLIWLVTALVLAAIPFSLQRRFLLGLYIPASALAVVGLFALRQRFPRWTRLLIPLVFFLSVPTNILLLVGSMGQAAQHPPALYLSRDEADGLAWIQEHTAPNALVAASPEMGIFIPALTGRRVLYGHPYETVNAGQEQQVLAQFFQKQQWLDPGDSLLRTRGVNYLFFGPRELALSGGITPVGAGLDLVYTSGQVKIFAITEAK